MYVGDSTFDIESGNGAGCVTCAVLWGVFPREKLESVNPTYIISKPAELLVVL